MICGELEELEAQFDEILTALEDERLTEQQRRALQDEYGRISRLIKDHQKIGHDGGPCYEE